MARGRRLYVDSNITPERLQPSASPVDSFVRTNAGSNLQQLAQSLTSLAPSLGRFTDVVEARNEDEQKALGEQKAREVHEARMTFNDAIKKGVIDEHQSPFFMAAFKQQSGRLAAGDYDAALRVAMAEDEGLQSSTDLADFDEFESKFRKEWVAQNVGDKNRDTQFEAGFGRMVDGFTLDAKRQFSTALGARVKAQAGENLYREMSQVLDTQWGKLDEKQITTQLNAVLKSYMDVNPKGGKIANEKAVAAVVDFATKLAQDDDPLAEDTAVKLMQNIDAGPGSKLMGTELARKSLAEARDKIFAERQARHRAQVADEEYQRTVESRAIYSDLNEALTSTQTPEKVDLKPFLSRMAVIDASPQARETLYKMQESFAQREYPVDDGTYADALMRVHGVHPEMPGFLSMRQAAGLLASKQITPAQYNLLSNEITQRDRQAKADADAAAKANGGSKLLNNRVYTLVNGLLRSSMVSDYDSSAEEKNAATQAQIDFTQQFLEAAQSGKMPTFDEAVRMADASFRAKGLDSMLEAKQSILEGAHKRAFEGTEGGSSTTARQLDFKKDPVVSQSMLEQVKAELKSGKLGPATAAIARQFGLTTKEQLADFLKSQEELAR